ncbi:unnamed protein product [Peniophora sp. CBMAI 1063]|nr:unnamed protein product [Peniophora sp. CBMAI 1063]
MSARRNTESPDAADTHRTESDAHSQESEAESGGSEEESGGTEAESEGDSETRSSRPTSPAAEESDPMEDIIDPNVRRRRPRQHFFFFGGVGRSHKANFLEARVKTWEIHRARGREAQRAYEHRVYEHYRRIWPEDVGRSLRQLYYQPLEERIREFLWNHREVDWSDEEGPSHA